MVTKWFKPKRHSGFDKELSIEKNLEVMYKKLKLKYPADRWRRVGRQALALANVTQDKETREKARKVSDIAFKNLEKSKK
jgi:hypothetical protein